MSLKRSKLIGLCWGLLIILVVWIDHWVMDLIFSFLACLLGAIVLTARSSSEEKDRREAKHIGIVLIVSGVLIALFVEYQWLIM